MPAFRLLDAAPPASAPRAGRRWFFGAPSAGELATASSASASSPPERSISRVTPAGSSSPPEPRLAVRSPVASDAGYALDVLVDRRVPARRGRPAGGRIVSSTSAITGAATRQRGQRPPLAPAARLADRSWRLVPLIASLIVVDALLGGGSPPEVRSVAAILVWWAVLVGRRVLARAAGAGPARGAGLRGAARGLRALHGALVGWAPSAERAFLEADRILLYTGVLLLPVLLCAAAATRAAGRTAWRSRSRWSALLALAQRLFPGLLPEGDVPELLPNAASRLSYPLGYWNGLAIFAALGFPLLLRAAVAARAPLVASRGACAAPVLAGTIYLTSSRGGRAVAVVATRCVRRALRAACGRSSPARVARRRVARGGGDPRPRARRSWTGRSTRPPRRTRAPRRRC